MARQLSTLGRVAFEAYSFAVGGTIHDGKPIPDWGRLTDSVRTAWEVAADAACNHAGPFSRDV